jgi:Domain of unknown function (DUF4411)
MVHVLDTSSFKVLSHYYSAHFPSVWEGIDLLVAEKKLIAVSEVFQELQKGGNKQFILDWATENKKIFLPPTNVESSFIADIFAIKKFQDLIGLKARGQATPIADPFIIASAKIRKGCVVTEEVDKPNSAKIPTICKHFNIDCTNIEGLMKREQWEF